MQIVDLRAEMRAGNRSIFSRPLQQALDDALKARRRLGFFATIGDEVFQLLIDVFGQILAQQIDINRAGAQHSHGFAVLGEAEEQMLKGCIFVMALIGGGQSTMQGLFEVAGEGRHRR